MGEVAVAAIPPPRRSKMLLLAPDDGGEAAPVDPRPEKRSLTTAAEGFDAAGGLEMLDPPNRSASKSTLLVGPFPEIVGVPVEICALVVPPLVPMPIKSKRSCKQETDDDKALVYVDTRYCIARKCLGHLHPGHLVQKERQTDC